MKYKFIILCLFVAMKAQLNAQNTHVLSEVKEEARQKASHFLNLIPEGNEKEYGFRDRAEFSRVQVGEPYETYYLSKQDEGLQFVPGHEWRVPLSVDGHYVALLTVQLVEGNPEAVAFGANVLAQKIQEFEKLHAGEGTERVLIRNVYLTQDYISNRFSATAGQPTAGGILGVDPNSAQVLYRINGDLPAKINMADLYQETMDLIRNTRSN